MFFFIALSLSNQLYSDTIDEEMKMGNVTVETEANIDKEFDDIETLQKYLENERIEQSIIKNICKKLLFSKSFNTVQHEFIMNALTKAQVVDRYQSGVKSLFKTFSRVSERKSSLLQVSWKENIIHLKYTKVTGKTESLALKTVDSWKKLLLWKVHKATDTEVRPLTRSEIERINDAIDAKVHPILKKLVA